MPLAVTAVLPRICLSLLDNVLKVLPSYLPVIPLPGDIDVSAVEYVVMYSYAEVR